MNGSTAGAAEALPQATPRLTGLHVNNSLTRSKDEFIPEHGRRVTWYICGPTVYDVAHMGHARNYVSFDILRRIMTDYLNYDMFMVMNITDIDDKIIVRSRERNVSFNDLARKYETEFMHDMKLLGVRLPDALTRVSEYVPEIIRYIERIMSNGYGYEANGSVYFDVGKFQASPSHSYAKLQPNAIGDAALLADGEGALSADAEAGDKRSRMDFALWKRSKEQEPSWESPWGPGRPGWHIECSAMACELLGSTLDLHAGGVDLKFPHHDNEIAQCEAYFESDRWVKYFLHSGHLSIDGLKMSKSLKNFITIREALERFSARQLRMLFLLHRYDAPIEYSEGTMQRALVADRLFSNFFLNVKTALRASASAASAASSDSEVRWRPRDVDAFKALQERQDAVHVALLDNFNTPAAMGELTELVRVANVYMADTDPAAAPRPFVLNSIARYIQRMFEVFGVVTDSAIGLSSESTAGSVEETVAPFLDAFSTFRDAVRNAARSNNTGSILAACDQVRDDVMPLLGVQLEDVPTGPSVWKLGDKEQLLKERHRKKEVENAKAAEKEARKEAERQKALQKAAQAAIDPATMFRSQADKYSAFDDQGIPTHGADGEPLSKNALKQLRKQFDAQTKLYQPSATATAEVESSPRPS